MNVSKLNYDELFIYQEEAICDTFGIMAQPYIILFVSICIQYIIEVFLAVLDLKYKSWFWRNKLSNKPTNYCSFLSSCCSYKIKYDSNILNHQELVYNGADKEPKAYKNFNMKGINVLIDLKNCEDIKKKMSKEYIKGVVNNCVIWNSILNPKFTSRIEGEGELKSNCKQEFNFSCIIRSLSLIYLLYQTFTIFYQVLSILIKFDYSGNNYWINFNNILFLIHNGSSYRTFIGIICANVAFPFVDSYLHYLRKDSVLSNPYTNLDFYYINPPPLGKKQYFQTFDEMERYLNISNDNPKFNDDKFKKYEEYNLIGRDRVYLGSALKKNSEIMEIDYVEEVIKENPYFTKNNIIIEDVKYFDRINNLPMEKKILIGSMSILLLPFILSGVFIFSIPIFFIYIWIFIFFVFIYFVMIIIQIKSKSNDITNEQNLFFTFNLTTNFFKRFVLISFLIIYFNYGVIFYDGKGYDETYNIEREKRNMTVYLDCMVLDKVQNSIDFLLTYT